MLSSPGSVLEMSNISLYKKFLLFPFCRGGQTAPLQWSWPGLSVTVCKAGRIGVSVGLGWLPHSSGVEKASLIHMHSLHLNLNCMSEWVWKVKSWGSSDMSDAIAVCSIQIQTRLLCLNVPSRETSPGLGIILAIAPMPEVSNWDWAQIWVCVQRLSSSNPIQNLSYKASAWSELL